MTNRPLGDSTRPRVAPIPTGPSAGLSHAPGVVPGAAVAEEEAGSEEGGEEGDGRCCGRGLSGGG
jgi:hypothetical protein